MKSSSESHITLVSERCNDQTRAVSKIFVSVSEPSVGLSTKYVFSFLLLFPVVSKLTSPVEIIDAVDSLLYQIPHHILSMHIQDDKCTHHVSLQHCQVSSHKVNHVFQLLIRELEEFFKSLLILALHNLVDGIGHSSSPHHLVNSEDSLSAFCEQPLVSMSSIWWVGLQTLHGNVIQGIPHLHFDHRQPQLDWTLGNNWYFEGDIFHFCRPHAENFRRLPSLCELHLHYIVEALSQMRLDSLGISSLREDLEELIVGEEVETRECSSLRLEVVFETLLDLIKILVVLLELTQQLLIVADFQHLWSFLGPSHMVLPELINMLELLCLVWQLLLDVFSVENVLKIHPGLLENQPLVQQVRDVTETLLPPSHKAPDFIYEL